jgi:hypothetical protein
MESTATTTTTADELSLSFLILDKLRGLSNAHGTLHVGVKPGERIVTDNIVKDMKQYFMIKMPKALDDIKDMQLLEKEYQVIMAAGEHINLIRIEEYHIEPNIVYMALDFPIAKSLYHYLTKTHVIDG